MMSVSPPCRHMRMVANAAATAKMTGVGTTKMGLNQRRRGTVVPSSRFRVEVVLPGDAVSFTVEPAVAGRFLDLETPAFQQFDEWVQSGRRFHVRARHAPEVPRAARGRRTERRRARVVPRGGATGDFRSKRR